MRFHRFMVAVLLTALTACATPASVREHAPSAIVSLGDDWNKAALCAVRKLDAVFSSNQLRQYPAEGYAEIIVSSSLSPSETILVVDIRDASPAHAVARIHASEGLVFRQMAVDQAAAAIRLCNGS